MVEAAAADASGSVHNIQMASADSMATPTSLLSTAAWEVAPLLAIQQDSFTGRVTRGYQLVAVSSSSTFTATPAALKPAEASVALHISLPIQPFYSSTTLSEKLSVLQLLSSIVGLTGIFSAFGLAFRATVLAKHQRKRGSCCGCCSACLYVPHRRSKLTQLGAAPRAGIGAVQMSAGSAATELVTTANPLMQRAASMRAVVSPTPAAPPEAAAAASTWLVQHDEDGDPYYVNPLTSESVWELPPGAQLDTRG